MSRRDWVEWAEMCVKIALLVFCAGLGAAAGIFALASAIGFAQWLTGIF